MTSDLVLNYNFRSMTADDLPLIRQWLSEPHVIEWWGDPDEQFGLVSGDLTEPAMDQYIISYQGQPFAYLQCYKLTDWNVDFEPQPEGTCGIDQMIGIHEMISRGHGSALIRQFCDMQLANGIPRMVVDPDPANPRAIRAYEKAGFNRDRLLETPDGLALLMVRDP